MGDKAKKQKLTGAEKKAETIKQRQDLLKKKLVEILERSPNLGAALANVGINRSTFSRWRDEDSNFSIEVNHAVEFAIETTADNVELSLLNSARNGEVAAQKYYLSNNHPRYMNKQLLEEKENPLTEERIKQIAECVEAWSYVDPDEDELASDYIHRD